jgi:hypothetical protein
MASVVTTAQSQTPADSSEPYTDAPRFKRLNINATLQPDPDWNEVLLRRLGRTSRCLRLLETIVELPTGTISHIEQIVAQGSELKEVYTSRHDTVSDV